MNNLDDLSIYMKLDPAGMLAGIKGFPEQVNKAWKSVSEFRIPGDYRDVDKVLVLGMGGSAIGGDLVRSLLEGESRVPVIVHRDYGLPHFANERTLIIASSYSGNTEETLSGFESALRMDGKKIAMTTGGRLGERAKEAGVPVFFIDYQGQPRAALPWSFVPTLGVLKKLGFLWDKEQDVAETVSLLDSLVTELSETVPLAENPAKKLAQNFYGNLPVIYGNGFTSEAAHRWKTQINENSKAWACYEVLPEMNHNATVGFPHPPELTGQLRVVFLRCSLMNKRVRLRMDITAELLKRAGIQYEFIDSKGESALAQTLYTVLLGDFISYYLAILYNIDPSPVEVIDYLKGQLAKG